MDLRIEHLEETRRQRLDLGRTRTDPDSYFDSYASDDDRLGLHRVFHRNTTIAGVDKSQFAMPKFTSPSMAPALSLMEPAYPKAERIPLPDPDGLAADLESVLQTRRSRRSYSGESMSLGVLSTLLDHAAGTSGGADVGELLDEEGGSLRSPLWDDDREEKPFRTYPSAGGLYPVEIYLLVNRVEELAEGVYHYNPVRHELRRLTGFDHGFERVVDEHLLGPEEEFNRANVVVALTGVFERVCAKYGDRGYRFALLEAGHLVQNVQLVGEALKLGTVPLGAADDEPGLNDLLGVNNVDEGLLYLVSVGKK